MTNILKTERNGLDLEKIAPDMGAKYSPNLYRWLQKQKARAWAFRVYRCSNNILWIGMLDGRELIGSKLLGVLCNGAKETTAAWQNIKAVEVTNFWIDYVAFGRCAIDPAHSMHFINDESRWSVTGDSRACQWCGRASQSFKRWTEQVKREEWVNQP